jgi:hypothetical protein
MGGVVLFAISGSEWWRGRGAQCKIRGSLHAKGLQQGICNIEQ